jgi:4-amino-4-deoxy-L-arabinose transferase-like glycosyltransferase
MTPFGARRLVRVSRLVRTCGRVVDERAPLLLTFWVLAAVVLTVVGHPALWRHAFAYSHAWASANFAIVARSFAEHGVIALGGIPIQNNDPLGAYPDVYLHWPPLFPVVLSLAFRAFGETEAVAHGLMLVVLLANVVAMYALVKAWAGREAGLLAAFALLMFPVTAKYGHLVIPEYPAILATLLALLAFIRATEGGSLNRAWASLGTICLMLAIGAAWQPLMMSPGLLIAAIWNRSRVQVRLALWYLFAAGAALVIVLGVYLLQWPDLWSDLVRTILYRTGITDFEPTRSHVHTIVNDALYARWSTPSWRVVLYTYVGRLDLIGEVATIAIGTALALIWGRRGQDDRGSARLVLGGLLAMWVLWFGVMVNHAYQHDMLMLLAAPAAAAAVGLSGQLVLQLADGAGTIHPAGGPLGSAGRAPGRAVDDLAAHDRRPGSTRQTRR